MAATIVRPMPRLTFALLPALSLLGCKPAEEPARHRLAEIASGTLPSDAPDIGPPDGAVRVTERITDLEPPPAAPPVIVEVTPTLPTDATTASAEVEEVRAAPDVGDARGEDQAVTYATRPEDLPAELVAALVKDVSGSARDEARRLNKLGLEEHKKLALDSARQRYLDALTAFPAYPFARYNLACALALEHHDDEALFHLAVLAYLAGTRGDAVSRERLEAARIDADFELLRDDARFRALTGATNVLLSWAAEAGDDGRKEARRLVKALREGHWPARLAQAPWQPPVAGQVIRVRAGDAVAEAASRAIATLLQDASTDASPTAWSIEIGAPLPPDSPPIVVVVAGSAPSDARPPEVGSPDAGSPDAGPSEDAPPEPETESPTTTIATLQDAVGRRLRAERTTADGVERHVLELKSTGFFAWETTEPGGARKRRTGRWTGGEARLSLAFKETSETPSVSGGAPRIDVRENLDLELPLAIGREGLVLDGLVFR